MSYSTKFLKDKITVLQPTDDRVTKWTTGATLHANVTFVRGARALHEGDITAYDSIMVRLRYTTEITRRSRLLIKGRYYAIDSFHDDYQDNTIQITASEVSKMKIEDADS